VLCAYYSEEEFDPDEEQSEDESAEGNLLSVRQLTVERCGVVQHCCSAANVILSCAGIYVVIYGILSA
jgi:hypothetical protein